MNKKKRYNQKDDIIDIIEEKLKKNKSYREIFGVSRQTATRDLLGLSKNGNISERGTFKDKSYFYEAYSEKIRRNLRHKFHKK